MKMKLKLKDLKVQSYVTSIDNDLKNKVVGGGTSNNPCPTGPTGCTDCTVCYPCIVDIRL